MKTSMVRALRGCSFLDCASLVTVLVLVLALCGTSAWGQPVITNQPQTQAVGRDKQVTFTVGMRGDEPLACQWQRNIGAGFSDMAGATNLALVLTNVQSWDAWDYRAVVTNPGGAQTSTVAHLYVVSPGLLTNRVVLDNFDDNHPTGWWLPLGGQLRETNQQLTVGGYWPGVITHDPPDTAAGAALSRNWSVGNCQTLEWRADLVGMNQGATAALFEVINSAIDTVTYVVFKGRDFIKINKYIGASGGPAHFLYENTSLPSSNVVLALALTRVTQGLILTARVLDKANHNAVLYERSVVDTPKVDRSLTEAEQQAASGMFLHAVNDIPAPPLMSGGFILLHAWQNNYDGQQPAAEVTFDNCELWTYRVPTTRFVDASNVNPAPPYTNWATAASMIQDAVDAAAPGDEVVVTNGIYATGGRTVGTNLLVNRVAVDKPLTLRSVNGPQFTVIQGRQVPGNINGDGAIRCVYLADGASLFGFTLTNGATRMIADELHDQIGGGVRCESLGSVVSNCAILGNSAHQIGGGVCGGTLYSCTLASNWAAQQFGSGGGAAYCDLNDCVVTSNSVAWVGGGVFFATLKNCLLTGNSARNGRGGGADLSTLENCTVIGNSARKGGGVARSTLNNCIVYFNNAPTGANFDQGSEGFVPNYSCTTPMPTNGFGNITNTPLFVDYAGGNLRLQTNSPCINAGHNSHVPGATDLDGHLRVVGGTVDIGAYEFQSPSSEISYAWLQQYALPFDGSADFTDDDADGLNNSQEWRCQTDPTDACSALRLLSAKADGNDLIITWQSMAGLDYFLERSTNLAASPRFTLRVANIPGQVGTTTFTETNATGWRQLFYRVGVQD